LPHFYVKLLTELECNIADTETLPTRRVGNAVEAAGDALMSLGDGDRA
jgi:hypothetical protein